MRRRVDRRYVMAAMTEFGIPAEMTRSFPQLHIEPSGLLIYGSRARGDAVEDSDLDVLALVDRPMPSIHSGNVSVAFYTSEQLASGIGTLFGAHLRRDAKVIWDVSGVLKAHISQMGDVDTDRLLARAWEMSQIFGALRRDLPRYLPGLLREARYLLRSCLYANAIASGNACFSVRELAQRHQDARLVWLLRSRNTLHPRQSELDECLTRLARILGELPPQSSRIIGSTHCE